MAEDSGATLRDGLFYGGAAYLVSYLFVYLGVLRQGNVEERVASTIAAEGGSSQEAAELAQLLVPQTWKYAGWLYHYSKGGTIGVSLNLVPGSYGLNHSLMFTPGVVNRVDSVRETALSNPLRLAEVASVVQSTDALTLVSVTPTALFVAGAVVAYRNGELGPIGGALAGGKVTAGFLALSVIGVHLFTATLSGVEVSASGAVSASGGVDAELVSASIGSEVGGGVSVEPKIEIGPSLGRAVLSGFFYPVVFGTMGGMVGAKAGLVASPVRVLRGLVD